MPRLSALHILRQILDRGTPLDAAVAADRRFSELSPQDRAFCRHLVATAIRRRGQIDAIIDHCLDRPLPDRAAGARHILRIGVCQLLFMEVPAYAAVDTSVELAAPFRAGDYRKLINGVLRRVDREGAAWRDAQDAARLNTPDWLWESWRAEYGEAACRAIAAAHLAEPPLDLSIKDDTAGWAAKLGAAVLPNGSLRLSGGGRVEELAGYADGAWWVQDAAAAIPAALLAPAPGMAVIDLCAAPGGKTAQLAAAGATVTAVDRSKPRMARLRENLGRLKLAAETVIADAAGWRPDAAADAVLIDAPCTATGTIRRHPDIAWLKTPRDLAATTALQKRLLTAATDMVRPAGTLVYAVCSLQPEEGATVVNAVLAGGAPLARLPIGRDECGGLGDGVTAAGDLRILPCQWAAQGGVDGFYVARLRRVA